MDLKWPGLQSKKLLNKSWEPLDTTISYMAWITDFRDTYICTTQLVELVSSGELKATKQKIISYKVTATFFWRKKKMIYSQTCSNDHLYKTTTRLRRPMLSPPKQILIRSLLYKTTTCLTRPATTFLSPESKKPV